MAYAWTNGVFLNPESTLPANGQAIAGIELPLVQGLLFDQRRAQLQQAELYHQANEIERQNIINDLLLKAIETYWQWAFFYERRTIYNTALELAENRLQLVKESFLQGDKPAIDTLESLIQVQNRRLALQQAQVDYENATLLLSNFLWYENLVPLEVTSQLKAENLEAIVVIDSETIATTLFQGLKMGHPALRALQNKQQQLEVKEKTEKRSTQAPTQP